MGCRLRSIVCKWSEHTRRNGIQSTGLSRLAIASPGTAPFRTTYNNFAPRLGAAFQLNGSQNWQAVVRGGFGVFYDLVSAETGNVLAQADPPFASFVFLGSAAFPFSAAMNAAPPIPSTGTLSEFREFNPSLKLPYTLQWNVALEQSLGKSKQFQPPMSVRRETDFCRQRTDDSPYDPDIGIAGFVDNTASSNSMRCRSNFDGVCLAACKRLRPTRGRIQSIALLRRMRIRPV